MVGRVFPWDDQRCMDKIMFRTKELKQYHVLEGQAIALVE